MTANKDENQLLQSFDGGIIRKNISDNVISIRKSFKLLPDQLTKSVLEISRELQTFWDQEEKEVKKELKRESALAKLNRWKEKSKKYRQIGLIKLTDLWYRELWKIRSDISLITAIYQYLEVDRIPTSQKDWKTDFIDELNGLVLRMKGPRKPNKSTITTKDIKYSVKSAFIEMMEPLLMWAEVTKIIVDNLTAPKNKMSYEVRIKRYRECVKAREYTTVLCQSLAPRQEGIKLLGEDTIYNIDND
ncbi:MAG: hypothetical protein OEY49_01000 [Candidatus Heimdallarchaeota archaeon]|nr:hypothetical protein [Candidatus Heimdallarchaeota archaeon]